MASQQGEVTRPAVSLATANRQGTTSADAGEPSDLKIVQQQQDTGERAPVSRPAAQSGSGWEERGEKAEQGTGRGAGGRGAPAVRLDMDLDADIEMKAKIKGDITLAVL